MAESNFHVLDINMVYSLDDQEEPATPLIEEEVLNYPWYVDILYVMFNLNAPPGFSKTKARFVKLKVVKFCILENFLYWKYVGGLLLNFLLKPDEDKVMQEFHEGDYGGEVPSLVRAIVRVL